MERASQVIPKSQHQGTPVYLGATAGMRLLRYSNRWGQRGLGVRLGIVRASEVMGWCHTSLTPQI